MSGQIVDGNCKGFLNGTSAIGYGLRVKVSSGVLALAGLTDAELGVADAPLTASEHGSVRLRTSSGTTPMVASGAISALAAVYTAADGKISSTEGTGAYQIGVALEAATADGDIIEVLRDAHMDLAT